MEKTWHLDHKTRRMVVSEERICCTPADVVFESLCVPALHCVGVPLLVWEGCCVCLSLMPFSCRTAVAQWHLGVVVMIPAVLCVLQW